MEEEKTWLSKYCCHCEKEIGFIFLFYKRRTGKFPDYVLCPYCNREIGPFRKIDLAVRKTHIAVMDKDFNYACEIGNTSKVGLSNILKRINKNKIRTNFNYK